MSSTYIPLCVPPWDEREALNAGARYSKELGFYTNPTLDFVDDVWTWLPRIYRDTDRPYLLPEMLPISTWQANVRHALNQEVWDRMRRHAYKAAGNRCEICGAAGIQLEAHEAWKWVINTKEQTGIQKLDKIMALCPLCHKAHHMGFAERMGVYDKVLAHLKKINGWDDKHLKLALIQGKETWDTRNKLNWKVDLSWLHKSGYIHA